MVARSTFFFRYRMIYLWHVHNTLYSVINGIDYITSTVNFDEVIHCSEKQKLQNVLAFVFLSSSLLLSNAG